MRLSIRWKLILSIVAPLLIIASVVMWLTLDRIYDYSSERRQQQVIEEARYYAARLDDRFTRVALVARMTADTLSLQALPDEATLYKMLASNLEKDPLIFGSAIAFEPNAFRPDTELFSPYVYRGGDKPVSMDIGKDGYDYTRDDHPWYSTIRNTQKARWSGPYIDKGAGGILMNTYSAPFYRDGRFSGVATVDVPLKKLDELIDFGNNSDHYFVIVNARGQFIYHPDPDMIWQGSVARTAEESANPELLKLAQRLTSGETGVVKVRQPDVFQSDEINWVFYAPVEVTGWAFAMTVPESEILGFLYTQMDRAIIGVIVMVALIVICVLVIGTSLTRPIYRLSQGVGELARGDMNIEIEGINSSDELGDLARGFNDMVAQLRRHVHALTREMAERETWETEMKFAHQVQVSLMPVGEPAFPEHEEFDLYGVYRPARHVAGDFFDFFMVGDRRLLLVIADVSGKGMASALLMAVTRTIVRNQARSGKSPAEILCEANRLLIETNMQSLFVTMFIASYDIDSGEITYANAGHPRPFKICCDDKVSKFGDTTGTIVGMLDEVEFTEAQDRLNPGDYLVLYTDGVTDARSPEGEFLGEENFIDLLRTYIGKPVEDLCENIVDILQGYQGNVLKDDTTLLVLKRN